MRHPYTLRSPFSPKFRMTTPKTVESFASDCVDASVTFSMFSVFHANRCQQHNSNNNNDKYNSAVYLYNLEDLNGIY